MNEIFKSTSQNGRWGLALVSAGIEDLRCGDPVQAAVTSLGEAEGHAVYRLEPTDDQQWAVAYSGEAGDADPLSGAIRIASVSLQGSRYATLLLLGPRALVQVWGYKRRSSRILYYERGESKRVPASVLLALGLLDGGSTPETVPPPPPFLDVPAPEARP